MVVSANFTNLSALVPALEKFSLDVCLRQEASFGCGLDGGLHRPETFWNLFWKDFVFWPALTASKHFCGRQWYRHVMILWRFLWCCFCFWPLLGGVVFDQNRMCQEIAVSTNSHLIFDPSIQLPSMPFPVHQWMQGWFRLALKASSAAHVHGLAPAWKVKKRSLSS